MKSHPPNPESDTAPRWDEDFPIRCGEDSYATRREFTKFLGLTSIALLVGTLLAAGKYLFRRRPAGPLRVGDIQSMSVNGYKLFRYQDEPCILLRLEKEKFVAFSQTCTHLNCPVYFAAAKRELICPCHEGHFSAEDGRVLAGPPKRPLTQFSVSLRDGAVCVQPQDEKSS